MARAAFAAACVLALCVPAAAAGFLAPLPASDYATRQVCPAPAPGRASCLAVELVPRTAAARARTHPLGMTRSAPVRAGKASEGAAGLRPQDLSGAYFPGAPPDAPAAEPQTIALVDAYDDPAVEADLGMYDKEFGLPPCTAANGCFKKVNQEGRPGPLPSTHGTEAAEAAAGWALEISTDVEVAHAVCQNCRIVLVEADSPTYTNLEAAEEAAVGAGATEVSNSWGGPEPERRGSEPAPDSRAFNHPGTVIAAAAGDDGYLNWTVAGKPGYFTGADYPASSPHVVAVGGTELTVESGVRTRETVWNADPPEGPDNGAGGSGCSADFSAPAWQLEMTDWASVGCGTGATATRAVADVAADGDPYTGVAVYDSVPYYVEPGRAVTPGWVPIGGTSVASPIIASMFALAGGAHGVAYPAQTLYYRHGRDGSPGLYDVTEGGTGACDDTYTGGCSGSLTSPLDCGAGALICNADPGYDGPSGVGAPTGLGAFAPESAAEHTKKVEAEAAAEKHAAEEREAAERKTREAREAAERTAREEREAAERQAATARAAEEAAHQREVEARDAEARRAEEERRAAERALAEAAGSLAGAVGGAGGGSAGVSGTLGAGTSGLGAGGATGHGGPAAGTGWGSGSSGVRLTGLALTAHASAALARGRLARAAVTFAFVLSAPARVRVTLTRLAVVHGHARWVAGQGDFTFAASGGRGHGRLRGQETLPPGRYRLTVTPAHGAGRSLAFTAR